jgi:hypothetical protein
MLFTKFPQTSLGILFIPYPFALKAHGNQQEDLICIELPLELLLQMFNRARSGNYL